MQHSSVFRNFEVDRGFLSILPNSSETVSGQGLNVGLSNSAGALCRISVRGPEGGDGGDASGDERSVAVVEGVSSTRKTETRRCQAMPSVRMTRQR